MGGQATIDSTYMYQNPASRNFMYQNPYMFSSNALEQDICGRPMVYAMRNGQTPYEMPLSFGSGDGNGAVQNLQASNGGGSPLLWGLGTGAVTGLAVNGFGLVKPVGEDGKFTEAFLREYSGEYAAMRNGKCCTQVFERMGKGVNETNFKTVLTDLEKLGLETQPSKISEMAKSNPLLKAVLEERGIVNAKGELIAGKSIQDVRNVFSSYKYMGNCLEAMPNYSVISQKINRFTGLETIWKNCKTREAQIEFLKKNADILGLKPEVIRDLHFNPKNVNLSEFKNMGNILTEKRGLWSDLLKNTEKEMQGLSGLWKKGSRWFEKGLFETAGKVGSETAVAIPGAARGVAEGLEKTAVEGLNKSYKTLLRRKAFIAAAVVGLGVWAYNKWFK